jgi:hypothetical protein
MAYSSDRRFCTPTLCGSVSKVTTLQTETLRLSTHLHFRCGANPVAEAKRLLPVPHHATTYDIINVYVEVDRVIPGDQGKALTLWGDLVGLKLACPQSTAGFQPYNTKLHFDSICISHGSSLPNPWMGLSVIGPELITNSKGLTLFPSFV